MNKKSAFLVSLILTISFYIFYIYFIDGPVQREEIIISRVIDGDTVESKDGRTIRLLNINSPEKNHPKSELGYEFLKKYKDKPIEMEVVSTDKYKRVLGRLYSDKYLNLELVKLGFASKFLVEGDEIKDFNDAENQAVGQSLGMWNLSSEFGCIKSKVYPEEEILILTSSCGSINMNKWELKDESRKIYILNREVYSITVHSGAGRDNSSDLYWNEGDVWNNDRDTIYLFDENNNIVLHESYGYD